MDLSFLFDDTSNAPTTQQKPSQNIDFNPIFNNNAKNTQIASNTAPTTSNDNNDTSWDDPFGDEQQSESKPLDLNFLFNENDTGKKTKKKKNKSYDNDVVQELVNLGYGTKEEVIEASKKCINYKDINEVRDILEKGKKHTSSKKKKKDKNYIKGYQKKTEVKRTGYGVGLTNNKMLDMHISSGNHVWSQVFYTNNFEQDLTTIYDKIQKAKNEETLKCYYHDNKPDTKPILIDVGGEFTFKLNRSGDDDGDDTKNEEQEEEEEEDDDNDFDDFDVDFYIKLINKTDSERSDEELDIKNYKKKKYDGIVAYLGMLNGMEMLGIELDHSSNDAFSKGRKDPFKKFVNNINESNNDQVTQYLMETQNNSYFSSRWDKCNNLEKKVFMLKYYLSVGPSLTKIGGLDQFPNIRKMSKTEIEQQNMILNGGLQGMFGAMVGGLMGDEETVECHTQ